MYKAALASGVGIHPSIRSVIDSLRIPDRRMSGLFRLALRIVPAQLLETWIRYSFQLITVRFLYMQAGQASNKHGSDKAPSSIWLSGSVWAPRWRWDRVAAAERGQNGTPLVLVIVHRQWDDEFVQIT